MSDYYQGSKLEITAEDLKEILSRCSDDCKIVILDYREIAEQKAYLNDHMISLDGKELVLQIAS